MFEFLQSNTSLPSLHPAIIHFPIALALTALLLRFVAVIRPGFRRADNSATLLSALAGLGAIGAWLSGRQAADAAGGLSATAEAALARHADWAGWAASLLVIAALVPLIWSRVSKQSQRGDAKAPAFVNFIVLTVAVGVVGWTADLGGALVYDHAVGVRKTALRAEPQPQSVADHGDGAGAPAAPLAFPDNKNDWEFMAGRDMTLEVAGAGLVALPGQWGNSVIEAKIDPGDFSGTLTLVHRYRATDDWEGFQFATDSTVRLIRQSSSGMEVRAESSVLFAREEFTMRSSAVAGHFKGLIDDDVVVHGHGKSGGPGQVGMLLNGTGTIRIVSMTASSAEH